MDLPIESTWEIFETTFVKRSTDFIVTDVVTIHIYDDDRDLFLLVKGHEEASVQSAINFIKEELPLGAMGVPNEEPDSHYFSLTSNPSQQKMRTVMNTVITKMESIGLQLRKLENTWV